MPDHKRTGPANLLSAEANLPKAEGMEEGKWKLDGGVKGDMSPVSNSRVPLFLELCSSPDL